MTHVLHLRYMTHVLVSFSALLHGEFSSREDDIYNSSYLESIEDSSEPSLEFHGFELLGIKYIPCVSAQHAKVMLELCLCLDVLSNLILALKKSLQSRQITFCEVLCNCKRQVNCKIILKRLLFLSKAGCIFGFLK